MISYAALCVAPTCRPQQPRRAQHAAHTCGPCEDRLRDNLRTIADTWPDLQDALNRSPTDPAAERVRGTRAVGLIINERASDASRQTADTVWFIARTIIEERGVTYRGTTSIPDVAKWIAFTHAPWIVRHPDPHLVAAITQDVDNARGATTRAAYPKGARRVDIPELTCRGTTNNNPCPGHMYLIAVPDTDTWADLICTHDGAHRIPPDVWRREAWHRRQMDPAAATALVRSVTR